LALVSSSDRLNILTLISATTFFSFADRRNKQPRISLKLTALSSAIRFDDVNFADVQKIIAPNCH